MPRTSLSPQSHPDHLSDLTDQQCEIVRLSLLEGWQMHRIATFLRISPRTCAREKQRALATIRTAKADHKEEELLRDGRIQWAVTILLDAHTPNTRTDITAKTVDCILSIPGYRKAWYLPDKHPEEVKAFIDRIDGRNLQKASRKKSA